MSRYVIGTIVIRAVDWPAGWIAYADEHWQRHEAVGEAPAQVDVAFVSKPWADDREVVIEDLSVEVLHDGCRVSAKEAFDARYEHAAARLTVEVYKHEEIPRITLANAVRGMASFRLPMHDDGLMLHACSGVLDDDGVVVAGVSTAGKTTLAKGMRRARYLSDDISLVGSLSSVPQVLGSPFFGIEGTRGDAVGGPLRAVAIMEKRLEGPTVVTRLAPAAALQSFMRHVVCWSSDAVLQRALLQRADDLVARVPFFRLQRSLQDDSDEVLERVIAAA